MSGLVAVKLMVAGVDGDGPTPACGGDEFLQRIADDCFQAAGDCRGGEHYCQVL